jgi:hypothetical protein
MTPARPRRGALECAVGREGLDPTGQSFAPAKESIGGDRRPGCCRAVLGYCPQEPGVEEDTVAWGLADQPLPIPPGECRGVEGWGRAGPSSPTGSVWLQPRAALAMARIPARTASGNLDQAAATSVSSVSVGAAGSTTGLTCPGSGFSSGLSVSGSGLTTRQWVEWI